ncbi:MAG: hypothetical protein Q8M29_01505 [Bacteroidota bacterium]|nr:hypothetical protein [Bacteroidota bacterium]
MKKYLDKIHTKTTVAYTVEGEKLTRGKLKKEVAHAHLRIKKGQFVEHSKLIFS